MIRVMIVDDHALVRLGIKKLLGDAKDINIVSEAESGEKALEIIEKSDPDVVLMDVNMPGMGGLEATKIITKKYPKIKILVVTIYEDEPYPSKVIKAGALGYITKGVGVDEMLRAIYAVYNGKRYLSLEIAQQLAFKNLSQTTDDILDKLSNNELQVLVMITSGHKINDIADQLLLSIKTINNYRHKIFEKLNIKNDVELTHFAIKHKLIDIDDKD